MPNCVRRFACVLARRAEGSCRVISRSREASSSNRPGLNLTFYPVITTREAGFTMIEMIATIALMSILMAMAVGGLTNYFSSKSVETAATELKAEMREAQSLAVSTGNTYRIDFSDTSLRSYTLQRRSGTEWINTRGAQTLPGGVTFSASSLPSFGNDRYLEFYSRGNTESGQLLLLGSFGKSKALSIDGETANVR